MLRIRRSLRRKKHVGIFCDGDIWHYSNAQKKVVRQMAAEFAQHFSGDEFALFFGTFPEGARALAVPATAAAVANAVAAPELRRGQTDDVDVAVWQQFLILRQLLSGPNIRSLLDGDFGPMTEEATEAFQVSVGLPATGVVDAATNNAAIERGLLPRVAATPRRALTQVTSAMTTAAVDALQRLGPSHVFYTEEVLDVLDGGHVIARLEPHKHTEGTQLRFWHRGITLYEFQAEQPIPTPPAPTPEPAVGHAGLDTSVYPGDAVMAFLRTSANLLWTGFYLPRHRIATLLG